MVLEIHMMLYCAESDFPKKVLPTKFGKWTKNWSKSGFFDFIETFCH